MVPSETEPLSVGISVTRRQGRWWERKVTPSHGDGSRDPRAGYIVRRTRLAVYATSTEP